MDRVEPCIGAVKSFSWGHRSFLECRRCSGLKGPLWRLCSVSTGVYFFVKAGVRGLYGVAQIGLLARHLLRRRTCVTTPWMARKEGRSLVRSPQRRGRGAVIREGLLCPVRGVRGVLRETDSAGVSNSDGAQTRRVLIPMARNGSMAASVAPVSVMRRSISDA